MMLFETLETLVPFAKARAQRYLYDGRCGPRAEFIMRRCSHEWRLTPFESVWIIYSRDVGHHESGWWKNPGYERCLHLSVSFLTWISRTPLPYIPKVAERIGRAFWGDDVRKSWIEGPYTPQGRTCDVHHFRLFCDPAWSPIQPRGEVYSRENTPSDWRSFSEIYGYKPEAEQAPFLLAASD
jgi:hypothetical protein